MKRGNKKAQLKISFGMLFSIILIAIFIALAVYGIVWFIGFQEGIKVKSFADELQHDIDRADVSGAEKVSYSYLISSGMSACFTDRHMEFNGDNMEIRKGGEFYADFTLDKVDLTQGLFIETSPDNCVDEENGRIHLEIEKKRGKRQIIISKVSS